MDQCKHCTARGDMLRCNEVTEAHGCTYRETWWAKKIQEDHDLQRRRLQHANNEELVRRRKAEFKVMGWKKRDLEWNQTYNATLWKIAQALQMKMDCADASNPDAIAEFIVHILTKCDRVVDMLNVVYDELNDPPGCYWGDDPEADQKLLESLLARVTKVVFPEGVPK